MKKVNATILAVLFALVLNAQCLPDYGFATKQLQTDSALINYIDQGKGMPLILIHGLGGNASHWKRNLAALSEKFRCIAIDLPGYGGSTIIHRADANSQLDYYADIIAALLQKLQISKAILMGHSMGGQISIIAALKYPTLVSKLILVSPAGLETFTPAEAGMLKAFATPAYYEKQDSAAIARSYRMNFLNMPAEAATLVSNRIAMKQCAGFLAYCTQISMGVQGMLAHPVKEQLSLIKQPTLVIFGDTDGLIPNKILHPALSVASVADIGKAIPDHQIQIISQAGHLVQYEQPFLVNQTVLQFLQ